MKRRRYAWSWNDLQEGKVAPDGPTAGLLDQALIGSDESNRQIGRRLGVSRETVRRRRKELERIGAIQGSDGTIRDLDEAILRMWRASVPVAMIAIRIGYHVSSVARRIKELTGRNPSSSRQEQGR